MYSVPAGQLAVKDATCICSMYFSICVKSWGPVYSCTEGKSTHRFHIPPGLSYVRHEIIHTVQLRQPMINDIIM